MKKRILAVLFSGLLVSGAALGQSGDRATGSDRARTSSSEGFRLTGVLISDTRQTAIVNGRILSVGDRVGGMEIVGISMGEVRVRNGDGDYTVRTGQTLTAAEMARAAVDFSRSRSPVPEPDLAPARRTDPDIRPGHAAAAYARHFVQPGETLSEIAMRYLADGVTLNDMIAALFRTNAEAFGGDADLLFAGTVLDIPDLERLDAPEPGLALAAVADESVELLPADARRTDEADPIAADHYGPIKVGETLSEIAPKFRREGVTREQVMIAILELNPEAFGDNVNVLYEGAVLQIPTGNDMLSRPPDRAAAEIHRQTDLWRAGRERYASLNADLPGIMAATERPAH